MAGLLAKLSYGTRFQLNLWTVISESYLDDKIFHPESYFLVMMKFLAFRSIEVISISSPALGFIAGVWQNISIN